jgi:hypothetical protein
MLPRSTVLELIGGETGAQRPTGYVVDRRYWIVHSDGFRVEGPSGRVRTVARSIEGQNRLVVR